MPNDTRIHITQRNCGRGDPSQDLAIRLHCEEAAVSNLARVEALPRGWLRFKGRVTGCDPFGENHLFLRPVSNGKEQDHYLTRGPHLTRTHGVVDKRSGRTMF